MKITYFVTNKQQQLVKLFEVGSTYKYSLIKANR